MAGCRRALAAALVMLFAGSAVTQARPPVIPRSAQLEVDSDRIDSMLQAMVADGRAAGVSALIWQDGREKYFGTAGFADRESSRPMTRDTLAQIWSMTKPVTGVALMQLWEEGRLRLDDPVSKYLPEFRAMEVVESAPGGRPRYRPADRPITVRDLLRHTSGIAYGGQDSPADQAFSRADPLNLQNDLAEASRRIGALPLHFSPGEQWRYSASVDVQARLVEVLSGLDFETYVRTHILGPLKMGDTSWRQPPANLARRAATYEVADGSLARQEDERMVATNFRPVRMTMGGAGLVSSIDDYMRFARMLLNGGELDGARILKASTVRLMATDQLDPAMKERFFLPSKGTVGFGFNFAVRTSPPADDKENRGEVGEFFWDGAASTLFWIDPRNRLAAVFFVQKMPFDGTLHRDIREAVYGRGYLGRPTN